MLTRKRGKVHSLSAPQTKVPQQHCQQSDLHHLSLLIQQFSSQLNLMLAQQQGQQQQKHSDNDIGGNIIDKQEQQTYTQQQHCPPEAYSHSNSCYDTMGSFSKSNSQCHCHSAYISPSLSTLYPLQYQHVPKCMHDPLYRTHFHHSSHFPSCYDSNPLSSCTVPTMCYCHSPSQQCTTTKTMIPPSVIDTTSHDIPGYTTMSTTPNSMDQYVSMTCAPSPSRHKSKSQSDPLPPLPMVDKEVMNVQKDAIAAEPSSLCASVDPTCERPSPTPQPSSLTEANVSQEQHHQALWTTDLYRQDLLAKQGSLRSSYNNILNEDQVNDMNAQRKGSKKQLDRSHVRGWWAHGKYKWTQLRKKSISPLFVSG